MSYYKLSPIQRLRQMLTSDPTRLLEFIIGLMVFLPRSVYLLFYGYSGEIDTFLSAVYLGEIQLGTLFLLQAIFQPSVSITNYRSLRILAGVSGLAICIAISVAFVEVDSVDRSGFVWVNIGILQTYIIFRNLMQPKSS